MPAGGRLGAEAYGTSSQPGALRDRFGAIDAGGLRSHLPTRDRTLEVGQSRGPILVAAAIQQLSKRDRNLLRFHYVARMTFEAIARSYHVNRSTAVRWLAAIRDDLDSAIRIRLFEELGISPTEIRSLWQAVQSDVEVSISRLLAAE